MDDQATPTQSPAGVEFYKRLGFGIVGLVFGGLVTWSLTAPIDGAVIAPGQVTVESNRKAVQHLEGGVIGALNVREGEFVNAGDIVAKLDDTVTRANAALIESQLAELYARRARLEAERDGDDAVALPKGDKEILNSAAFDRRLMGQKRLFEARVATGKTQIALLEERIVQQETRISGFEAQQTSLTNQLRLIRDELKGVRELHAEGYAPKTRLRALERELERLVGERGALKANVAEAISIIAEAKLEVSRLQDGVRQEAITELRDVEVQISELEERRVAALDALRRTDIRAPQNGRVLNLAVHTIGGVIGPGAPLMEIVPENDRLQVSARVTPQDVDKVRAGQDTLVRFSAFGSRRTPETTGAVQTVSADSITDAENGISYYLVRIDIPNGDDLSVILNGEELVPGMPVETFIRTGSRSAIDYFLKPLTDSMARSMREE